MEIVLTHNNMDFDSLAAQFAVTKLFPTARILPGYPLVGNVREFISLYRDSLPLSQLKYIDIDQVSRIFIVDCQQGDRLDENARRLLLDPGRIPYTIYDHHHIDALGLGPGASADSIIRPVGSTTTLLVGQIRQRKIKLTPFEATLLAIGIYEDTGCLTYSGTGPDDADCVSYLLSQGADLTRINDFLHPKMTDQQVELMETLIHNSKAINVGGAKVVIARASLTRYLDGLATLTRKLVEIQSADAVVSVAKMRDRIHLVGRSDSPAIDIRALMQRFGGDGHPGAASAVVREGSVASVADQVEEVLRSMEQPERTAGEIMTSPVRTIRTKTSMEEAGRIMLRYDLDGLLVAEGDAIVGVVSRRDIDQAAHHKLGHAPVQGFMSRPVITISPTTTLSEIQRVMVHEDIGRLPVMDEHGRLMGIVSRREVLHTLYGQGDTTGDTGIDPAGAGEQVCLIERMEVLDPPTRWLMEQIGVVAARLGMVAYAVGGCVRDMLLGRPNFDLDFVSEGSAIELAHALETTYPSRLQLAARHDRFQTATLNFHAGVKREVDLSTARTEFYEFPAALPTVEASSLRQDLFRRDFTINALAICLNPADYGELVDYFGGLKDLKAGLVRVLHPFSFIEDPTRIVRAARFAARLGFKLERWTREQAERAIAMGIFDDLGGVRMRTELTLILESPQRLKALDLLGELGGRLRYLDSELEYGPRVRRLLRLAERLLSRYTIDCDWVIYLGLLISQLNPARRDAVQERLHLSNEHKHHIAKGLDLPEQLKTVTEDARPSQIYALLHGHSDQSLAIAACMPPPGSPLRRMIKLYLERLKHVDVSVNGADLIRMGFPQGPDIGRALTELTEAKLDGTVHTLKEEMAFLRERLSS